MHSPLEIAINYIEIGIHKVRLSAFKMLVLGIFAGMFIGFAGIGSTTAMVTVENQSIARLVGACIFPAGMAMVLIAGSELFTGNTLLVICLLERKIRMREMLKNWFFVFAGNFLGASFVAVLVVFGHVPDLFGGRLADSVVSAALHRVNLSFVDSMFRGILCNILVCIAIWAAFGAKKVSGKLMMSFWPVMLFVLCGFEHSIADVYFCVAGILTAGEYGIAAEGLNMGSFLLKNLLPVTLGNIIGGAGIVGVGYWAMFLMHTPGSEVSVQAEQEELEIAEEY